MKLEFVSSYYPIQYYIGILFLLELFQAPVSAVETSSLSWLQESRTLFHKGNFKEGVKLIDSNLAYSGISLNTLCDALTLKANSLQRPGSFQKAYKNLRRITRKITNLPPRRQVTTYIRISDLFLSIGRNAEAVQYAENANTIATQLNNPAVLVNTLHAVANTLMIKSGLSYHPLEGKEEDKKIQPLFSEDMLMNNQLAITLLKDCERLLIDLPNNFDKGFLYLSLGNLTSQFYHPVSVDKHFDLSLFSWKALSNADQVGKNIGSVYLQSYAKGYLACLYEYQRRVNEAMHLTRQAIFFAQQESISEVLDQWHWQLGRLLARNENNTNAIESYKRAIKTLDKIRNSLSVGYRRAPDIFGERVKPVYYELADLNIREAEKSKDHLEGQHHLQKARNIIKKMKSAELEDFFQDDCITAYKAKEIHLDRFASNVAVVYPIILKQRSALLVTQPDGIRLYTSPVTVQLFDQIVRSYRSHLQEETSLDYKSESKKLYDWLIQPIMEEHLLSRNINTLIIVPDSSLTLVLFSSLYDGNEFLIEKIIGGQIIQNQEVTVERISDELKESNYRLMHIATHSKFDNNPENTFLLTFNERLTLNSLEQLIKYSKFHDEPLELLTLSACETAVGDEKAALGLAGVAIKSGASNVLASLWYFIDQATTELITEFYKRYFTDDHLTKAQALQMAQKKLISNPEFNHPSQWAPFLVIGNWL